MRGWGGVRPAAGTGKAAPCSRCGATTYLWPGVTRDKVLCTKCLLKDNTAEERAVNHETT